MVCECTSTIRRKLLTMDERRYMLRIPERLDHWDQPKPAEDYVDETCATDGLARTGPLKFDYAGHPFVSFSACKTREE